MGMLSRAITVVARLAIGTAMTVLFGCAGNSLQPSGKLQAPWPPPESNARQVNSAVLTVLGKDYVDSGGTVGVAGDVLTLSGGADYSYAVFTIGGLSDVNECRSVTVSCTGDHIGHIVGTRMYVGVGHYLSGAWQWAENSAASWTKDYTVPAAYRSPGGVLAVAIAVTGAGQVQVQQLQFTIDSGPVSAPQNLTAEATGVELITLNWDDTANASGYNAYRGLIHDFSDGAKINPAPIPASTYQDEVPLREVMLYYKVTAIGTTESALSNMVDIWAPGIDMPAPQNPRQTDSTETSFTVAWDWAGTNPTGGFYVYWAEFPNFEIDGTTQYKMLVPFSRQSVLSGMDPAKIYYWRVAGYADTGQIGRMTDDLPGQCGGAWTWGPVENVGTGKIPLEGLAAEGDIACAYYKADSSVEFAKRNAGTWTEEPTGLDASVSNSGFGSYLGLAFGGSKYLVCSYTALFDDIWGAVRDAGTWTETSIDADGSGGVGHPYQGQVCRAAASDTEFAVLYGKSSDGISFSSAVATSNISGAPSWTKTTICPLGLSPIQHSLCFAGGDLGVLEEDSINHQLLFGTRSGGYAMSDIADSAPQNLGWYNDLNRIGSEWITTAYNPSAGVKSLFELRGTDGSAPWASTLIAGGSDSSQQGSNADLGLTTTGAYAVYYGTNPNTWHLAAYDGATWTTFSLTVSGVPTNKIEGLKLVVLNDEPYVVFRNLNDGKIKCAKGNPPA